MVATEAETYEQLAKRLAEIEGTLNTAGNVGAAIIGGLFLICVLLFIMSYFSHDGGL